MFYACFALRKKYEKLSNVSVVTEREIERHARKRRKFSVIMRHLKISINYILNKGKTIFLGSFVDFFILNAHSKNEEEESDKKMCLADVRADLGEEIEELSQQSNSE